MGLRPLLQFPPVSAHPILSAPGTHFLTQARVPGRVVRVAHDLLPEAVEAVVHVLEVQALRFVVVHFRERCPQYGLYQRGGGVSWKPPLPPRRMR